MMQQFVSALHAFVSQDYRIREQLAARYTESGIPRDLIEHFDALTV